MLFCGWGLWKHLVTFGHPGRYARGLGKLPFVHSNNERAAQLEVRVHPFPQVKPLISIVWLSVLATQNSDPSGSSFPSSPTFPLAQALGNTLRLRVQSQPVPCLHRSRQLTSIPWTMFQRPPRSSSLQPSPAASTGWGKSWSRLLAPLLKCSADPARKESSFGAGFPNAKWMPAEVTFHSPFGKHNLSCQTTQRIWTLTSLL